MVEACESRRGERLPESVRQWYLIDGVVPLRHDADWQTRASNQQGHVQPKQNRRQNRTIAAVHTSIVHRGRGERSNTRFR